MAQVQRTTWVSGLCLTAAAVLSLVVALHVVVPVTETVLVPLSGPFTAVPAALLQCAGLVVLAVGLHDEPGAAGTSAVGRTALIVFALQQPLTVLLGLLPAPAAPLAFPLGVFGSFDVVFLAAGAVAAIAVVRAGVLHGAARWLLLPLAVVLPATAALFFTVSALRSAPALLPGADVVTAIPTGPLEVLPALLLLATALSLLVHGRTAALREVLREA